MKPEAHRRTNALRAQKDSLEPKPHFIHRKVDLSLFILILVSCLSISVIVYNWQSINKTLNAQSTSAMPLSERESASLTIRKENVRKLESFFAKNESPLYPYARLIVEQAEQYGVDYRLLPAIAMNESTLCKNIHSDSYNCWGWGIYGDRVTRFDSYDDAIRTITKGIREQYYDRGMSSPSSIMRAYTPSSPNGVWATKIEWTYRQIDKQ